MRRFLAAFLLLLPGTCFAHAILISSEPSAQASVRPGQTSIVLHYNSRIDHARSRLVLQGSNAEMILPLLPDSAADTLAARQELTPGQYTVHWQVLAVDGHITRGDVRFTVQAP